MVRGSYILSAGNDLFFDLQLTARLKLQFKVEPPLLKVWILPCNYIINSFMYYSSYYVFQHVSGTEPDCQLLTALITCGH